MKLVVFDLDGTLVDVTGLEPWMLGERTDYDLYHELCMDRKPIYPMLDEWRLWEDVAEIDSQWIVTGRGVQYSQQTFQWLNRYQIYAGKVRFRDRDDTRPGVDVKRDILSEILDLGHTIEMAYEDDPDIYEMMVNEFAIPTVFVPGFPVREQAQ